MKYEYCNQCPGLLRQREPDPDDWFNDDDEGRYCKHVLEKGNPKKIEGMCRPYEKTTPAIWCPFNVADMSSVSGNEVQLNCHKCNNMFVTDEPEKHKRYAIDKECHLCSDCIKGFESRRHEIIHKSEEENYV